MGQTTPVAAVGTFSIGGPCRRLLITAPGAVEIVEQRLRPLGATDVYARTVLSGISHGTETAWLSASVTWSRSTHLTPTATWSPRMRQQPACYPRQ